MQIEKIITLTSISLCSTCPNYDNCFELFGFDIMIDNKYKPWLLEVNSSPAMAMDGPADSKVKPDLIKDTLRLIDFEPYEVYNKKSQMKNKRSNGNLIK